MSTIRLAVVSIGNVTAFPSLFPRIAATPDGCPPIIGEAGIGTWAKSNTAPGNGVAGAPGTVGSTIPPGGVARTGGTPNGYPALAGGTSTAMAYCEVESGLPNLKRAVSANSPKAGAAVTSVSSRGAG